MARNNLELKRVGDRTYVNYWDSIHGEDVIFVLGRGKAYRQSWHGDDERLELVDLVEALSELAKRLE